MKITDVTPVNNTTNTFLFRLKSEQKVKGLKKWYGNVNMIGRHFVVSSDDALEEKRHYTICNTMQQTVLQALTILAETAINPGTSLNPEEQSNFEDVFDRSE